nr:MAG TPA: hypothetical protein [Caudoviricetes sp.]
MNLRATINGKQYDILQGATFAEEFNETLDSGSIVISGVEKINDLLPYDDVYIYSFKDLNYKFKGYPFDTKNNPQPKFYKHLLVDQFTEEVLRLGDKRGAGTYKYKIELMSETKKLETIQLPNISITQPIKGTKTSVWEYANRFVNLYSPTYKKKLTENTWSNVKKYTLDSDLQNIFGNTYAPDFVLNAPSLRALLSKLFLVKDIIPYVKDDVIYGMDISKRNGEFNDDKKYVNIITGTRTSDNHCDNLRRNYSDALVQDRTCRSVEYVGFRNSDNALMTISNMRLELGMPIYKIRKVYLCYYKHIKVNYTNAVTKPEGVTGVQDGVMLCKQDITKLIKLNTERNLLSQDWEKLTKTDYPKTDDDMAKYKFCTVGYDIGSRFITGWGDMYTYPTFWNDNKYTSIQNIVSKMDYFYPFGIYSAQYVADKFGEGCTVSTTLDPNFWKHVEDLDFSGNSNGTVNSFFSTVESPFTNKSLKLKGLFFIVDYEGFYNGAIIHSKKNHRDDITINDNTSESLTLVEQDAIFQNEKINRFGNKALQINARYDSFYDSNDEELLQPLASVYSSSYEDDVVIYHREYSIYNNCVQCIYYGIKNYVLKNWFTSVYAKYRTWDLMSYNESVKRAENEKEYIYWSENELYYENKENLLSAYETDANSTVLNDIISCFSSWTLSNIVGTYSFLIDKNINYACIGLDKDTIYSSDLNAFVANNSMCFNLKLNDNFSQGLYISKAEPFIGARWNDVNPNPEAEGGHKVGDLITEDNWVKQIWDFFIEPANSDYSGSTQDYYSIVDDATTGETKSIMFYVAHAPQNTLDVWKTGNNFGNTVTENYNNKIFAIPKSINSWNAMSQKIGVQKDFYKDNKSFIDMTLQIENLTMSNNIILSPWVMKLSDLLGDYPKFDRTIIYTSNPINRGVQYIISEFASEEVVQGVYAVARNSPIITFKFYSDIIEQSIEDSVLYDFASQLDFMLNPHYSESYPLSKDKVMLQSFKCEKIRFKNNKKTMQLCGKLSMVYQYGSLPQSYALISEIPFIFTLLQMGQQGSLVSSIMPNTNQSEQYFGLSLDNSVIYYSSLIDKQTYTWADAYNPKTNLNAGYAILPGDIVGGYETDLKYSEKEDYKQGTFVFTYDNKTITLSGSGRTALSDYVRSDLNQGQYNYGSRKAWSGENITTLHNIISGGVIELEEEKHATYYKNMFLHYDTENRLDAQMLKDSYKYNEIRSDLSFNFKSPISRYFVSQLNNVNTPYIEIISLFSVICQDGKVPAAIWRDCKKSASDIESGEHTTIILPDGNKVTYYFINKPDIYLANPDDISETGEIASTGIIISTDGKSYVVASYSDSQFKVYIDDRFIATKLKALSFWYLDDSRDGYNISLDPMGYVQNFDYNPDNCYCHFVFGVNIDDNFSRKIYLSMLKKKDLRVFDEYHKVIGESRNYLKPDGTIDTDENTGYGTSQQFTEKK